MCGMSDTRKNMKTNKMTLLTAALLGALMFDVAFALEVSREHYALSIQPDDVFVAD
jgi:hypothetical protein